MKTDNPPLPSGYSPVPKGKVATVVTCLEMLARPLAKTATRDGQPFAIERWISPDSAEYRAHFRAVGEDWMWVSRLEMAEQTLRALLDSPLVEVYVLRDVDRRIGLLELDFRQDGECELTYFGLVVDAIGKGAGRFLMEAAIATAWSHPIRRFWVHTCHFDHPAALNFYQRSGFTPYAQMVEVIDDPRLTGLAPRTASPHVPLIG